MPSTTLGARIRALRERAGIKSQDLAAAIGLDPSAMSNIERDKRSVKADEINRIAAYIGVSPLALLDEDSLLARLPVAPRAGDAQTADGTAMRRLIGLAELHVVLADAGIDTAANLADVPIQSGGSWRENAEALATWARDRLPEDESGERRFAALVDLIENDLGVDVLVEHHGRDEVSGAALTDREFPLIFVNADEMQSRALFTLAHEVGHVLSGHGEALTLDLDLSPVSDSERFANAFAASFLMPQDQIEAVLCENDRGVVALARMVDRFGVSFTSLLYRLLNLRLITAEGRDQLREVGLRGLIDLLDDVALSRRLIGRLGTKPERHAPSLLTQRSIAGHARGIISVRPLASLLDMDEALLLKRLDPSKGEAAEVVEAQDFTPPAGESPTDDELFAGSPL